MSFFTLSTGEQAKASTEFEIQGGGSKPIPAGSVLLVVITEAKWDNYNGEDYISLRWDVVGKEYTKRVIFQKLKVADTDPKKRDKAIMMMMAIDANTGGHLAKVKGTPTNDDLQKILNRKMCIIVDVWELKDEQTGEVKSGNWIKMVASVDYGKEKIKEMGGNPKPKEAHETIKQTPKPVSVNIDIEEDDLPF